MPQPAPISIWAMLLSHHGPESLNRCLSLGSGKRRLWLCARCAGLYPTLAAATVARLTLAEGMFVVAHQESLAIASLVASVLGAAAWAAEQARVGMSNAIRVTSGVFIGSGLGWSLGEHLRSPWNPEMLHIASALVFVMLVGLVLRLGLGRKPAMADLLAPLPPRSPPPDQAVIRNERPISGNIEDKPTPLRESDPMDDGPSGSGSSGCSEAK